MPPEAPKYKKASYVAGAVLLAIVSLLIYRPPYIHRGPAPTATVYPAVTIPVLPTGYWEFENPTPLASVPGYVNTPILPEGGSSNLTYSSVGGASGQYAIFTDVNGKYYTLGKTDLSFSPTDLGIEMALKPNQWYHDVNLVQTADNSVKIWILADHHLTNTSAYRIAFTVNTTGGSELLNLDFDKIPPKAISAIFDNNWHHFFFKVKPGKLEVWVDGIKLASKNITGTVILGSSKAIQINNGNAQAHRNYYGKMDSVRLYNVDVPENLIWEHAQNMKAGVNYSDTTTLTNIANTPALTAQFDPEDYLPNAILPNPSSNTHNQFTNYTVTPPAVTTQLFSVPLPRYKTNTILGRNVPVNELTYFTMTGLNDHYSEFGAPLTYVNRAVTIASEFANKWNYYLDLRVLENSGPQPSELKKSPGCTAPCENFMGHLLEYANLHPNIPTFLGTNRAQESNTACGNENCLNYQGHPASAYLRNGAGQFVNTAGTVVSAPNKIWNPIAPPSLYSPDGAKQINQLNQIVSKLPNRDPARAIDFIVDNGEVLHQYPDAVVVNNANPAQPDPSLNAGFLASSFFSLPDSLHVRIQKYLASLLVAEETFSYRDPMLSIPQLNNTDYGMYAWDGWDTSTRWYWSEARKLLTPKNGQYYATTEMYTRYPWNWDAVSGASNGAYYLRYAVNKQISAGDTFYSPYVAPGWNINTTVNITPGQWLGMLKNMANMGAEYFLPAYFNRIGVTECNDGQDNDGDGLIDYDPNIGVFTDDLQCLSYADNDESGSTYDSPDGYQATKVWQFLQPSYAQAVFSRIDTLYKNSTLLAGDLPWDPNDVLMTSGIPGYQFKTGNPEDWVTVRKVTGQNIYIIAANKNQVTNMAGSVATVAPATITLAGSPISFDIRPQGSVYLYDNTSAGAPRFYQLDTWHEKKHPYRWSSDFNVEAELYDTGSTVLKTEGTGVATKNFTGGNYQTYVNPASGTLGYYIEPRNPAGGNALETRYLWYRAKAVSGAATAQINVNGTNAKSLSTTASVYEWCNKDATGNVISFPNLVQNQQNTINFIAPTSNTVNFHFDQFVLTTNPSLNLGTCTGPSNIPPTVSYIAPTPTNNSTISGSVMLAANAADADGTIAEVSFTYNGPQSGLIVADVTSPYTTSWDTTSVQDGTYTLTATAKDNLGATTAVSRTFTVLNTLPNVPPTISYVPTTPADGSTINAAVGLYTNAADSDGTITNVVFSYSGPTSGQIFNDNTSPYECVWNTTIISDGSYTVTATATDNDGAQTSVSITLSVLNNPANVPPTINFTAPTPAGGSTVSNSVNLAANAADSDGTIDQVKFFYTGASNGTIFIDTISPYDTPWDTTSVPNGAYQIKATATDNDGGTKTVSRNITVNNVTSNNAPTVVFASPTPADGSTVSASITLTANATDSDGTVASVEFEYSGPQSGSLIIDNSAPYDTPWDTTSVSDGTYTITATATDNLGAQSIDTRTLIVNNAPTDTVDPQILISAPLADANLQMKISTTVQVYATDNVGVSEVRVYMGNTLKCTIPVSNQATTSESCVFQIPWFMWAYNFTIKAEAYDAAGNKGSVIIPAHAV